MDELDRRLLERLGAKGPYPPVLPEGWALDDDLADLRLEAATMLTPAERGPSAVIEDPRLCLSLPCWRAASSRPLIGMLLVAEPLAAAASHAAAGVSTDPRASHSTSGHSDARSRRCGAYRSP